MEKKRARQTSKTGRSLGARGVLIFSRAIRSRSVAGQEVNRYNSSGAGTRGRLVGARTAVMAVCGG